MNLLTNTTPPPPLTSEKIESFQVLRGIAVLFVVFFHMGIFVAGGVGVDIFFCISSFIMMYITDTQKFSIKKFYLNRITRIVPLYWIMTIIAVAGEQFIFSFAEHKSGLYFSIPEFFKSLFFVPYHNEVSQPYWGLDGL